MERPILKKLICNYKVPIQPNNLGNKSKVRRLTLSNCKVYSKATIISGIVRQQLRLVKDYKLPGPSG